MWKISSLIGPVSNVREILVPGEFISKQKLSASLAIYGPVSVMIIYKMQHLCGFVFVIADFWLFIWMYV